MSNKNTGFSLIELAVVLFLLSLVLGGVMTPLATRIEQADRQQTEATLKEIKDALFGYVLVNGHLPCPDCSSTHSSTGGICDAGVAATTFLADDGIEDGADGGGTPLNARPFAQCAQTQGNLPWVSLGVPELDAWDNHFLYRVTDDHADSDDGSPDVTPCGTPTVGVSFSLCSTADITINDETGASVATNVPAIVVSLGNDTSNDGASQAENQDDDGTFVDRRFSSEEESATDDSYDDMLIWTSPAALMYQMIRAERLP